jgi:hypothetical protein
MTVGCGPAQWFFRKGKSHCPLPIGNCPLIGGEKIQKEDSLRINAQCAMRNGQWAMWAPGFIP